MRKKTFNTQTNLHFKRKTNIQNCKSIFFVERKKKQNHTYKHTSFLDIDKTNTCKLQTTYFYCIKREAEQKRKYKTKNMKSNRINSIEKLKRFLFKEKNRKENKETKRILYKRRKIKEKNKKLNNLHKRVFCYKIHIQTKFQVQDHDVNFGYGTLK